LFPIPAPLFSSLAPTFVLSEFQGFTSGLVLIASKKSLFIEGITDLICPSC